MTDRVPVSQLTPAPWNPRTIRDTRFKALCDSLRADPAFLDLRPILATADGTIYAGNMRYRAAVQLGWADVPAVLADVDERTAKERALRDNRHWGDDQEDELAALVYELGQQGAALDSLGFEPEALARLIDATGADGVEPVPPDMPYEQQYAVTVLCTGEEHQREVYERLTADGYSCKVLVV